MLVLTPCLSDHHNPGYKELEIGARTKKTVLNLNRVPRILLDDGIGHKANSVSPGAIGVWRLRGKTSFTFSLLVLV